MSTHIFGFLPIPLHRNAVEETCTCCGIRSWRYKDGTRWIERPGECSGAVPLGGKGTKEQLQKLENQ